MTVTEHPMSVIVSDKDNGRGEVKKYDDVLSLTFYEGKWVMHFADRQEEVPEGFFPVFVNGTGTRQVAR
jgi:hypothetical protein